MSASGSTQKTCMECGTDVSAKPRVKDAQGRYLCAGECQRKYQARVPAAAARPPAPKPAAKPMREPELDSGMLSNLIADSPMMTARRCEGCGNPLLNNAVLCLSCGFNVSTGKAMKTRVAVETVKEPKAARVKSKGSNPFGDYRVGPSAWAIFGVLAVVGAILSLLPFVNHELMPVTAIGVRLFSMITGLAILFTLWQEEATVLFALVVLTRVLRIAIMAMPGGVFIVLGVELLAAVLVLLQSESAWTKAMIGASFLTSILSTITFVVIAIDKTGG